jgi:hypothetical protein
VAQPEHILQNKIRLALGQYPHARFFRNNVAEGWTGNSTVIQKPTQVLLQPGDVVIRNGRRLHAGLVKGSGDMIGWIQHQGAAIFASLEIKTASGRLRPEQENWIEVVRSQNGIAEVVRSPEDAIRIVTSVKTAQF